MEYDEGDLIPGTKPFDYASYVSEGPGPSNWNQYYQEERYLAMDGDGTHNYGGAYGNPDNFVPPFTAQGDGYYYIQHDAHYTDYNAFGSDDVYYFVSEFPEAAGGVVEPPRPQYHYPPSFGNPRNRYLRKGRPAFYKETEPISTGTQTLPRFPEQQSQRSLSPSTEKGPDKNNILKKMSDKIIDTMVELKKAGIEESSMPSKLNLDELKRNETTLKIGKAEFLGKGTDTLNDKAHQVEGNKSGVSSTEQRGPSDHEASSNSKQSEEGKFDKECQTKITLDGKVRRRFLSDV